MPGAFLTKLFMALATLPLAWLLFQLLARRPPSQHPLLRWVQRKGFTATVNALALLLLALSAVAVGLMLVHG